MSISVASRKSKARNLQQNIASKVANLFNINFNNQDDLCPIKSRIMGESGCDIYITNKEIADKFPFGIETKSCEKPSIKSWINQAKSNTKQNHNFLLFWKCKDFRKPVVILDSEVFFELLEKIYKK